MAAGAYQVKKPEGERMAVYVYSRVPDLAQVLENRQLPLELMEISPGSEDGRSRDLCRQATNKQEVNGWLEIHTYIPLIHTC